MVISVFYFARNFYKEFCFAYLDSSDLSSPVRKHNYSYAPNTYHLPIRYPAAIDLCRTKTARHLTEGYDRSGTGVFVNWLLFGWETPQFARYGLVYA